MDAFKLLAINSVAQLAGGLVGKYLMETTVCTVWYASARLMSLLYLCLAAESMPRASGHRVQRATPIICCSQVDHSLQRWRRHHSIAGVHGVAEGAPPHFVGAQCARHPSDLPLLRYRFAS
eukprot:scaffold1399_cov410-Prasinococcus_capsulatus_cf.AAC.28